MLPSRNLDGPVGAVLVSLYLILNGCPGTAAFCPSEADTYLFEEGSARFNPLMEGGVICWVASPKQPQVLVDAAPGEAVLVAHGVYQLEGVVAATIVAVIALLLLGRRSRSSRR